MSYRNSSDVECTDGKFNMTNRQVGTDNNVCTYMYYVCCVSRCVLCIQESVV